MNKIYFDAVSSTAPDKEVVETYKKLLDRHLYNSDALYDDAVKIYDMQEKAREMIASLLHVLPEEIIFTSGASESNSMAIKSFCLNQNERHHIVTTATEHHSLFNSVRQLEERFGYEVTYLRPDEKGRITADMVKEALRKDTALVSIMAANNELGLIYDIDEIKRVVKLNPGTAFHCDLTQAIGKIDVDLKDIDMASFSAHKIHGLKGSGVLVKKKHIALMPLISGGQQEFGLRGGTSNALENIVLAKTLRLALERKDQYHDAVSAIHKRLVEGLSEIKGVHVNLFEKQVNCLINITTPVQSEVMVNALNLQGIMVSSKSTCGSRKNDINNTLQIMGIDDNYALRISFDYTNTLEEAERFISCLKEIIHKYG